MRYVVLGWCHNIDIFDIIWHLCHLRILCCRYAAYEASYLYQPSSDSSISAFRLSANRIIVLGYLEWKARWKTCRQWRPARRRANIRYIAAFALLIDFSMRRRRQNGPVCFNMSRRRRPWHRRVNDVTIFLNRLGFSLKSLYQPASVIATLCLFNDAMAWAPSRLSHITPNGK